MEGLGMKSGYVSQQKYGTFFSIHLLSKVLHLLMHSLLDLLIH